MEILVNGKSFRPYITSDQINERIGLMAREIEKDADGGEIVFIAVLNGSFLFAADLVRCLTIPCKVTFVKVASYEGTQSTGKLTELIGLREDISGKNVVVIDDI